SQPAKTPIIVRQNASCDLPKFSGSPTEWPVFISTYNRTTQLYGLSNDENLIRLEKSLIGKARDSVASLLIHPKNVDVILESLTMKYGQPERIVHELTKQISSISSINEGRFDDLVDFALTVQNYCATVEACELNGYLYNDMLLHNLCQKLPPSLSLRWAEFKMSKNDVTLQTFNKWLHSIAKAAIPITLHGEGKSIVTYAFLDDGSELSLIEEDLARELRLEGPEKMLCLKWTNDIRRFENASMSVNVKISGNKENTSFVMSNVRTIKDLKLPRQTLNMNELKKKYRYLANIPVESYKNAVPRILIGLDNSKLGAIQKCHEGGQGQPIAGKTRLGWMVYGCCNQISTLSSFLTHHSLHITKCQCNCDEVLHRNMKEYFSLDSMGNYTGQVPPLNKLELLNAQNWLYRRVQEEIFAEEIALLKDAKQLQRTSSIFRMSPILDENGVMRTRGRIDVYRYTDLHVQDAIILPADHHVTKLIIQFFHRNLFHRNHETAINQIRLRYLIPGLRKAYRKMRGNCQRCKNESAFPHPPMMGELPAARLAVFTRPFAYVGIDYFGPITISIGRRTEKRWGVIVTCLTTRAIHLELAYSLSTDSCIMALRSFMARRGAPTEIYSDNGTNFRGASKELVVTVMLIDRNKSIQEIESPHTTWKFIPPASRHMGGAWERLVRSVKTNLSGKQLPRTPTEEVLRSALVEIENTINSRPLTHLPIDDVSAGVLTPNHLLLGSSNGLKPLAVLDDTVAVVKKGWELSKIMANVFWRQWITAYLPTITRRTKWFKPVKPIEVGDIVVIADPQSPRNSWPKGKVIAVKKSPDGQVRKATVQTAQGIYERPAVKIAVLDVDERHRSE
uniref:Integrase catalytic domain-containing protein n=1 Tax=Anopheles epiroticus TaxID=199890 RepID=A0A182PWK8_9DIPT